MVQQIQFLDDKDEENLEQLDNCSFLDKSIEKIIIKEKKIIQKVSSTIDSTKEWTLNHFSNLPEWLQDNEYLHYGHRGPLNSFSACFQSIFKKHTGTFYLTFELMDKVNYYFFKLYLLFPRNRKHLDAFNFVFSIPIFCYLSALVQ